LVVLGVAPLWVVLVSLRVRKKESYQDTVKYFMTLNLHSPAYEIIKNKTTIPVVANIPHSSVLIPQDIRESLLLNDQELEQELLCMTDRYTHELFASISEFGGVVIRFSQSRLVLDPERYLDDKDEPMASMGMGVVYLKTSTGQDLRKPLSRQDRDNLIVRFYTPYHKAIEQEVASMLEQFGKCLIIDCHSFSSKPLPHEPNQDSARPDICLGTDPFHTPVSLIEMIEGCFKRAGLTTKRNMPFEGTYVPIEYLGKNTRVSSIMVEVNRKLYMDEVTGEKNADFLRVKEAIASIVKSLL